MERQGQRGPEAARVARLQPMSCFHLMNLHQRVVRSQRCLISSKMCFHFCFCSFLLFAFLLPLLFFSFLRHFSSFLKFIVYLEFPFFTLALAFFLSCSFAFVFPLFLETKLCFSCAWRLVFVPFSHQLFRTRKR